MEGVYLHALSVSRELVFIPVVVVCRWERREEV
jgi:hypothetical protein